MSGDKKIEIDYTTVEGIIAGLKEIKTLQEHVSGVKLESEITLNMLEKHKQECINALIYGKGYPRTSSAFYIPAKFVW